MLLYASFIHVMYLACTARIRNCGDGIIIWATASQPIIDH